MIRYVGAVSVPTLSEMIYRIYGVANIGRNHTPLQPHIHKRNGKRILILHNPFILVIVDSRFAH